VDAALGWPASPADLARARSSSSEEEGRKTSASVGVKIEDKYEDQACEEESQGQETQVIGKALCKACGASVLWVKTAEGRSIQVDPDPTEKGNLALDRQGVVRPAPYGSMDPKYRSHFLVCPNKRVIRKYRDS
jgi:hypothetical protein